MYISPLSRGGLECIVKCINIDIGTVQYCTVHIAHKLTRHVPARCVLTLGLREGEARKEELRGGDDGCAGTVHI